MLEDIVGPTASFSGFDSLTYSWRDFNGDGLSDLLIDQHVSPWQHWLMLSTGTTLSPPQTLGSFGLEKSTFSWIDYNSDGILDLICDQNDPDNNKFEHNVLLTKNGQLQAPIPIANNFGLPGCTFNWLDFNGDGRADLACDQYFPTGQLYDHFILFRTNESLESGNSLSNPELVGSFNPVADSIQYVWIDFNGDGLSDLAVDQNDEKTQQFQHWVLISNGETFENTPIDLGTYGLENCTYSWADFNADGNHDLLYDQNDLSGDNHYVVISNGVEFEEEIQLPNFYQPGSRISWIDFNSDGMADMLVDQNYSGQYGHWVLLSTGKDLEEPIELQQFGDGECTYSWTDFNGDGLLDLAYDQDENSYLHAVFLHEPFYPDLLNKMENGLGGSTSLEYNHLTDKEVYTKRSGAIFPNQDVQNATYVVSHQTTNDGRFNPRSYNYSFTYTGAVVNSWGKGWLGFQSISMYDHQTRVTSKTSYLIDYPFSGLVDSTLVTSPDNKPLSLSYYLYDTLNTYKKVQQPLKMREFMNYYDLVEEYSYTIGKEYTYDKFGNQKVLWDRGDTLLLSDDLYIRSNYINNTSDWRLGFPTWTWTSGNCAMGSDKALAQCLDTLKLDSMEYYPGTEMKLKSQNAWNSSTRSWQTTTHKYDEFGNAIESSNPQTGISRTMYDTLYHTFPIQLVNALGRKTTDIYDARTGNQLYHINENRDTLKNEYDGFGRITAVWSPGPAGNPVKIKQIDRNFTNPVSSGGLFYTETKFRDDWDEEDMSKWSWKREYKDGLERSFRAQTGRYDQKNPINKLVEYDNEARIHRESLPFYQGQDTSWTTYEYDPFGRLFQTQLPNGLIKRTYRDIKPYKKIVLNRNRIVTAAGTSDSSVLVNYIDARGSIAFALYPKSPSDKTEPEAIFYRDPLKRIVGIDAPNNAQTRVHYNTLNGKDSVFNTSSGWTRFSFLENGLMKTQTDAKHNVVRFAYDVLGRNTLKIASGSGTEADSILFYYDSLSGNPYVHNTVGQLVKVDHYKEKKLFVSNEYSYTHNLQIDTIALEHNNQKYMLCRAFNPHGWLTKEVLPDSTWTDMKYGPEGFLSSAAMIKNADTLSTAKMMRYTAQGKPERVEYGNEISNSFVYDDVGQLDTVHIFKDSNTIYRQAFERNIRQEIIQVNDLINATKNETFTYCNNGYLLSASGIYGDLNYGYDPAGNLTLKDSTRYQYSGQQLTGSSDGLSVTYDANGNMRKRKTGIDNIQYFFDNRNHLSAVIGNSDTLLTFGYDHNGRRLLKEKTDSVRTIYISPNYEVSYYKSGKIETTKFLKSKNGIISAITEIQKTANRATYYYHQNEVSSVTLLTDESGNEVTQLTYLPFGELYKPSDEETNAKRKFAGKEFDDLSGLYYYGARYYDPVLGRFISADDNALGGDGDNAAILNRYVYAFNNPVNLVDHTGNSVLSIFKGLLSLVIAVAIAVVINPLVALTYYAGASVNGNANPGKWKWNSPRTWLGITLGPPIFIGAAIATDGIADAVIATGIESAEVVGNIVGGAITGAVSNGAMSLIGGSSPGEVAESALIGGTLGGLFGGISSLHIAPEGGEPGPVKLADCDCQTPNESIGAKANQGGGCFVAGTLIATNRGLKPIEYISIGDSVWARQEYDHDVHLKEVTKVFQRVTKKIYVFSLTEDEKIESTPEHVFWVQDKGWIEAELILISDTLFSRSGEKVGIYDITVEEYEYRAVYNFIVAENHTYYVSDTGILVHNNGCLGRFARSTYRWANGSYRQVLYRGTNNISEIDAMVNRGVLESHAERIGVQDNGWNSGYAARLLHSVDSRSPITSHYVGGSRFQYVADRWYAPGDPNSVLLRYEIERNDLWAQLNPITFLYEFEMLGREGAPVHNVEIVKGTLPGNLRARQ